MVDLYDILLGDVIPQSGTKISFGRNTYDPPAPAVPVHDIHTRQLHYHDIGESGVVQYNATRDRLELNPSNSGIQGVITSVMISAYDGTGGTNIAVAATDVTIDTVQYNSHSSVFALAGNAIQINMSGVYEITYVTSADESTGTRTSVQWGLFRQEPGGSFAFVPGTSSFSYHRQASNGEDTATAKTIFPNVGPGQKFKIQGQILAGAATVPLIQHGSSLTIRKVG